MRNFSTAVLGICSIGCLMACGGSNTSTTLTTTPPTQVTLTVSGSTPTAAGSQVDGGSWTSLALSGSTATFTVPKPTSNYAVAVLCPVSPSSNPNQSEVVIEANVGDIASPTIYCPPETTVTMTVNYDLTAVAGAQEAAIAIGRDVSPITSGANGLATLSNVVAGTQDVGVVAYGAAPTSAPLGIEILRGLNVSGSTLSVPPMSTSDEALAATIGVSGVSTGYTSFLFAQYVTAGGAIIPVNGNGAASYGLIASGNAASGDFYSVQATAIDASKYHFVEALESSTNPQNLTLTLPAPFIYSGPSPAAYPSFNATYNGFTGSGKTGWIAAINWVDAPSATIRGVFVYATSAFLGSSSVTIPNLSSLNAFLPGPPSNTPLGWVLMPFQQSDYYFAFNAIASPPSESAQYSSAGGSFIVP